jgi:hypothetical protein
MIGIIAAGIAVALTTSKTPVLTLRVLDLRNVSGTPVARVEMRNRGDKSLVYYLHSISQKPCYHWLERSGGSWHRPLGDWECGIDLVQATLAAGQTVSFTASVVDGGRPTRLALVYWREGAEHTALTEAIVP